MNDWTKSIGLINYSEKFESYPSFCGIYRGYYCEISLKSEGIGPEFLLLSIHFVVLSNSLLNNDLSLILTGSKQINATRNLLSKMKNLDKYSFEKVTRLLESQELNRNLLNQRGGRLYVSSNKISYIMNQVDLETEDLQNITDGLIDLVRKIDQIMPIIESIHKNAE